VISCSVILPDMFNRQMCPGGGVALLYASKELDKLQTANFDQKIGVQIIQNALKVREKEQIKTTLFLTSFTLVLS